MPHEYIKLVARAIYADIPTWSHAVSLVSDPHPYLFSYFLLAIYDAKMSYYGSLKKSLLIKIGHKNASKNHVFYFLTCIRKHHQTFWPQTQVQTRP